MARSMPAFSIMHQSRPQRKPVPAIGDLTPVRRGALCNYIMVCQKGHEGAYNTTMLRTAEKEKRHVRCRTCVAIEKAAGSSSTEHPSQKRQAPHR